MQATEHAGHAATLAADLDLLLPDLGRIGAATIAGTQHLRTSYYDTPDLRLWERGLTLRVRVGERQDAATWTLDTLRRGAPVTAGGSWPGRRHTIPDDALGLVRGVVRRAPLREVAELVTNRRRMTLHDERGEPSIEVDDDVVTVIAGDTPARQFRQIGVECRHQTCDAFDEVVRALRRAGARPREGHVLARALDLATSADRPATRDRPAESLGDVIRACIRDALDDLVDADLTIRLQQADPGAEDVDAARIAARRLWSELKVLRPALDPVWVDHRRQELQWLAGVLGQVRDADVLGAWLVLHPEGRAVDGCGHRQLRALVVQQRGAASRELAEALASQHYLNLLDRLHAAATSPPLYRRDGRGRSGAGGSGDADRAAARALPRLVRRRWRALDLAVRDGGRQPTDAMLRRIRTDAMQLRYAAEMAAPVSGKPARRLAAKAEVLQAVLGQHHDAVAAEEWLRRSAAAAPGAAFVAGLLAAEQVQRQHVRRRLWAAAWADLDQRRLRAWLR